MSEGEGGSPGGVSFLFKVVGGGSPSSDVTLVWLFWAQLVLQHQHGSRSPRRRSRNFLMLFVVIGFPAGIVILLSVILRKLRLNLGYLHLGCLTRNLILGWRRQHAPPANLLGVRRISVIHLLRYVLSRHRRRWHLRRSAYGTLYVVPELIISAHLAGQKSLTRNIGGRHLIVLRLFKPELDHPLFPSVAQLRHDQARVCVRHYLN